METEKPPRLVSGSVLVMTRIGLAFLIRYFMSAFLASSEPGRVQVTFQDRSSVVESLAKSEGQDLGLEGVGHLRGF